MKLTLAGVSHHKAPIELRERVALDLDACRELAVRLEGEAVVLSTCNRTELYLAREDHVEELAVGTLAELAGDRGDDLSAALYRLRDEAAALHLFRVAAGLDSLVPGEGEILGQVRTAFEAGSPGPFLDRLFRQALHAGRRVRLETAISESPASVPSAAAALAQQVFDDLSGRRVLVLGAGKMSESTARNLVSRGADVAVVANRTLAHGEELARRLGAQAIELEAIGAELEHADVVVSATSASDHVVTRDEVAAALRARKGRPLLLVDLAVPRDLDPTINELDGCFLYDVDDLEAVVTETLSGRRTEAAACGASRRGRGRPLPRVAGGARRRADDRIAARACRGDPGQRAGAGGRAALRARAQARRVGDVADPRKAPASAHDPHERGRRGSRWGGLC